MKYKNISRHKMLIQSGAGAIREVVSGEVFETNEVLSYSFLEEVKPKVAKAPAPKTSKKKKVTPIVEEKLDGSNNTEDKSLR